MARGSQALLGEFREDVVHNPILVGAIEARDVLVSVRPLIDVPVLVVESSASLTAATVAAKVMNFILLFDQKFDQKIISQKFSFPPDFEYSETLLSKKLVFPLKLIISIKSKGLLVLYNLL